MIEWTEEPQRNDRPPWCRATVGEVHMTVRPLPKGRWSRWNYVIRICGEAYVQGVEADYPTMAKAKDACEARFALWEAFWQPEKPIPQTRSEQLLAVFDAFPELREIVVAGMGHQSECLQHRGNGVLCHDELLEPCQVCRFTKAVGVIQKLIDVIWKRHDAVG